LVAESDVVDVDEDLVAALLVPHLVPGVAGVLQDGPHRGEPPPGSVRQEMPVAGRVGGGWGDDAVGGEAVGDSPEPTAAEELAEDARDHWGGGRVGLETPGA
jgi:hypothetical protein